MTVLPGTQSVQSAGQLSCDVRPQRHKRMLDLDHPRTPHVFAASRQLDLILDYLKRISCADRKGRLFMLEILRPCFAALRWLQAQRFADEPHVVTGIEELEWAAE